MEQDFHEPSHDETTQRLAAVTHSSALTALLRRALTDLNASAVGLTAAAGGRPRYFTRSAGAAKFFEDICNGAIEQLSGETQARSGIFGTNRIRSDPHGPVRGRLLAISLREPNGLPLGLLMATRLIDEPKFGAAESEKLQALAPEFIAALVPKSGVPAPGPIAAPAPKPAAAQKPNPLSVPTLVPAATLAVPTLSPAPAEPPPAPASPHVTALLDWAAFEKAIRSHESADHLPGSVLYGDMDQVHVLNKLGGFGTGDRAIAEVGAALQTAPLPAGSCACHLSGDRFTVYAPHTTLAQARRIAEQLSKSVSALSVEVHAVPAPLSISFGVATIPASEGGLGHALAAAEAACKAAKDRGRGRVEVYQDADLSIVQRNDDVLVADRLRHALQAGHIEVFGQPIVRLRGEQSTPHYELLVRLIGEAGTHISPAWFMSAATRYRMLPELDRAVLQHIFRHLRKHHDALTHKPMRFSVNLSGPSIGDPDFIEWLGTHVGGCGVPGHWLQFEITETAAVANVTQTQALMRRLKARGVTFALDDFGTGVSSFAYLRFFDVSMLKLDGSFMRDLLGNARAESLVHGIAQLGRGMNIETVAECVESADVRDRLAELGVDCAQGFYFGRPRPLEDILAAELGQSGHEEAEPTAEAMLVKSKDPAAA